MLTKHCFNAGECFVVMIFSLLQIIRAIDMDDPATMLRVYNKKKHLGAGSLTNI